MCALLFNSSLSRFSLMSTFLLFILISIFHFQLGVPLSSNPYESDSSYMKFVEDAKDLPEKEEYDYIIIGGGTAGCPLAATLSSKYSVLLLERGSEPNKYPSLLKEGELLSVYTVEDDGENPFQRFVSEDGVENIRGRVLGGTSMLNGGFYSRGHREFFDTSGVDWDMGLVDEAYQWVEETVVSQPNLSAWSAAFRTALLEAGVGPDNGFELSHLVGTRTGGSNFDGYGNRHGAVELLNKADPNNIKVAIRATVQRILFSGLSASGVSYSDSTGKLHTAFIRNKGEIISSAGAIGSPQLLLLSGVGPESHLSSLKLPVVLHQPHVGESMSDNPRFSAHIMLPYHLPITAVKVVGTLQNNIHFQSITSVLPFSIPPSYSLLPPKSNYSTKLGIASIVGKFSDVLSEGSLKLNSSTDVKTNPIVQFNYFSHPHDLAKCVEGVRKMGDLLEAQAMENIKIKDFEGKKGLEFLGPTLPENLSDVGSVEEYCKKTVTSCWHYHGGCLVGKVVDGNYSVIGIQNLRVVDGSTFLLSPGTNPMATLFMLGRYIGVKILQQRSTKEEQNLPICKVVS